MEKDININLNDKNEKNIQNRKRQKEQIEKKNETGIGSNKNKFTKRNKVYDVCQNGHLELDKPKNKNHIYKVDKIKKESGITIITLVVTILIIIILASITINAVLGDNGLLSQAQDAKDLAERTTIETGDKMNKVLQEYMNVMAEDEGGITEPEEDTTPPTVIITEGDITENSIEINVTANDPESGLASENPYIYYLNGEEKMRSNSNSYTFTELTASTQYTIKVEVYNGVGIKGEDSITISTTAKPGLSADEIQQNPSTYYGAEVKGYTCSSNGVSKWRIFYADESNIYLIADDYISSANVPTSTANHSLNVGSTNYSLYFTNILNDYSGSSWIRGNTNSNAQKWLDTYLNSSYGTSTNANMKAVAYLMDTNKWSVYAGSAAEYAIGGPTLELFCASYKDTHTSRYLQCDSVNSTGYQIKWNDGSYGYTLSGLTPDELNGIYIKKDTTKTNCMWLASPSAYGSDILFDVDYTGTVDFSRYYGGAVGLRPLVCLKSEVQLERVDSDTFRIVE